MGNNREVAVVTGGARGIGKAICEELADHGWNIAVVDMQQHVAEETAAELRTRKVDAEAFMCNVTDATAVNDLITRIVENFGRIDVLVNNAGITRDNLLIRMKTEEWQSVLDVNLNGTFNCIKAVARPMMKARRGKIVNIASVVGIVGNPGQSNYSASKAGVLGLTRSIARELASREINVNAVAPGYIWTDMTKELPEEAKKAFLNSIPLGRPGTVKDVAKAVRFLASSDADYLTGQTINVDGGMVMG
ncbi:MAG: 3-oxoacyl-[acyl-carrier-protein] reductase [Verrucomicrobiota bacterium]